MCSVRIRGSYSYGDGWGREMPSEMKNEEGVYLRLARRVVLQQQGRLRISSLRVHGGGASAAPLLLRKKGRLLLRVSGAWVQAKADDGKETRRTFQLPS